MGRVGRIPVCPYCHQKIETEQYKVYKNRKYHYECYLETVKTVKVAKEVKKDFFSDADYNEIQKYVIELYKTVDTVDNIKKSLKKQVDSLIEKNGYTYKGILGTLIYVHKILGKPIYDRMSLGIVSYFYDEAKEFFNDIDRANKENREKGNGETVVTRITTPDCKMKMIDIEDL